MWTGYATSLCSIPSSRATQIFSGYSPDCHSQNSVHSFKIDSQSSEIPGIEPEISPAIFISSSFSNCSRSFCKIRSFNIELHTHIQQRGFQKLRVQQPGMHIRFHSISFPISLCIFSEVALQMNQSNPCLPHFHD